MKTSSWLLGLASAVLLSSCLQKENSQSMTINDMEIKDGEIVSNDGTKVAKSDYTNTQLETVYENLVPAKIYIVDENDNPMNGTEVKLNTKFSIIFEGIKGYTLQNGKAHPKFSMFVNGDGGIIVNEMDLFANNPDGFSEADASVLRGTVTVGEPMKPGQQYVCTLNIADKNNPDGYIMATWIFQVAE